MQRRILVTLFILAALAAIVWFVKCRQTNTQLIVNQPNTEQSTPRQNSGAGTAKSKVPDYALEVLRYIRRNGEAPDGYVGGREFENREKKLPAKDPQKKRIRYSEWDVRPKVQGKNRGKERLVTGSDHSAWYSKDHYKTFMKIEE
jgi:ribonuclease T1